LTEQERLSIGDKPKDWCFLDRPLAYKKHIRNKEGPISYKIYKYKKLNGV